MKRALVLFVMVFLAAGVVWSSAQGEAAGAQQVTDIRFQLNWKITGDHAAYYVAQDKGWFEEEGLDVEIIIGQGSGYTVQALDTGKAEIGISDAPVPISGRAQGANVKIVGIIFDKHPNCMFFWKDSGIRTPQDIQGKTVAVPASDGHKVMWPAFARLIGVPEDSVNFVNIEPAAKVAALASRKADVVFELFTGKAFMEKAVPPEDLGAIIWADHGFDAYAHSLIARDDVLEEQPEAVRGFLKAAYRGWDFTLKNPEEAIEILAKYHPINQQDYVANLKLVMEFFKTDRYRDKGIGYIDPERLKATMDLVENYRGVEIDFTPDEMYTSIFLPDPMYKYNWK